MINAIPVFNLEIAHIRAFEEGGKRYDPTWSIEERNSFANLILLCSAHHKVVDGANSDKYPISVLEKWKAAREADGLDALAGLSNVTESKLSEMIATAQSELLDRVGPALEEFGKTAPELAALLKLLLAELADPRVHGFGLPEELVRMLYSSSRTFAGLEGTAKELTVAANRLGNIEGLAIKLKQAANAANTAASRLADARY
ncbi:MULTISPECIES: HNH endonuclease [Kitasatospora]|nr:MULTISPECIES: HNH endonuclease [Kitasatospora]